MGITCSLFQAGYCTHRADIVLQDEKRKEMKLPALFALIDHPTHGYILFDTGYSKRFYEATAVFPYSIYAKVTPVTVRTGESANEQLMRNGVTPQDISYVFISHFHADHIAGLKDFPHSQFICSKAGYESIKRKTGLRALKAGFIPSLMPSDFEERAIFIEDSPLFVDKDQDISQEKMSFIQTYENIFDVFGDGTLLSVDLSGHAIGQYGLFFKMDEQHVFLIADAVWRSRSYREKVYPKSIAKFIMSNAKQYKQNFDKLHEFHKKMPNIMMIPSHCDEVIGGFT